MHKKPLLLILSITSFVLATYLIFSGISALSPSIPNTPTNSLTPTPIESEPTQSQTLGETTQQLFLVTKVIDGDTFEIEGGERVRLIGIDTPETVDPNRPDGCFGQEASGQTKALLEGQWVRLENDISDQDRYGRLVKYVYLNNIFINDYLVRQGFAKAYPYPPDTKFKNQFEAAQTEAKTLRRGLWGSC